MIWVIIGIIFFILCVIACWHFISFAQILIWFVAFVIVVPAFIGGLFSIMLPNDVMSRNTIVNNYDLIPFDNGKYIEYNNKGQMFYKTEEGYQMDNTPSNNIFYDVEGHPSYTNLVWTTYVKWSWQWWICLPIDTPSVDSYYLTN